MSHQHKKLVAIELTPLECIMLQHDTRSEIASLEVALRNTLGGEAKFHLETAIKLRTALIAKIQTAEKHFTA